MRRREEHRRRLPVRLHLEPDAGEHLRDRGADGAVAGQAVVGEMEADLEAVRVAGLGEQLARALNVRAQLGELLVVAEDAGGHHLVDRPAEALHRHLGERRPVDREIDASRTRASLNGFCGRAEPSLAKICGGLSRKSNSMLKT